MRSGFSHGWAGSLWPMPVVLIAYFFIEAFAFYGVAKLIGVGWALFWIFALMVLGAAFASMSLRGTLLSAAEGRTTVEKLAGDSALLMVGWVLSIIPGFATSFAGLMLIFGPTRGLIRNSLTAKVQRDVENFSARVYNASPMARYTTSYGSFTGTAAGEGPSTNPAGQPRESTEHPVIDADELEKMYRLDSPNRPDDKNGNT